MSPSNGIIAPPLLCTRPSDDWEFDGQFYGQRVIATRDLTNQEDTQPNYGITSRYTMHAPGARFLPILLCLDFENKTLVILYHYHCVSIVVFNILCNKEEMLTFCLFL